MFCFDGASIVSCVINASVNLLIQRMSVDVKELEDLRVALMCARPRFSDEGNRQLIDATVVMIDEEIDLLESDS